MKRFGRRWPVIRVMPNQLLVMSTRELEGREASPTAGVIDSLSIPEQYGAPDKIGLSSLSRCYERLRPR